MPDDDGGDDDDDDDDGPLDVHGVCLPMSRKKQQVTETSASHSFVCHVPNAIYLDPGTHGGSQKDRLFQFEVMHRIVLWMVAVGRIQPRLNGHGRSGYPTFLGKPARARVASDRVDPCHSRGPFCPASL